MQTWERFSDHARRVVIHAQEEASKLGVEHFDTEHLLLGLLLERDCVGFRVLTRCGVSPSRLKPEVEKYLRSDPSARDVTPKLSESAKEVLSMALKEARTLGHNYVGTEHLLLGLIRVGKGVAARILAEFGVDLRTARQQVLDCLKEGAPDGGSQEAKGQTPHLDHFGRDLTAMAREGKLDPIIGRDAEIARVIQILSRRTKNNVCLIGEPGVGKTAIVEGLAQRIADSQVPDKLSGRRIVALDMAGVVAGTKYRGEFEERMKKLLDEIRASEGQVLIFIDELHTLVGAGAAEGAMDASNILKPALARGEIRCIGATTLDEFRKYIEKNASLERRFQSVMVREPSVEEAVAILRGIQDRYEEHHDVRFQPEAIEVAVRLSHRYITDRCLPDKAIDVVDEAGSRRSLQIPAVPASIRELEARLSAARGAKELAVDQAEFEEAQHHKEEEQRLQRMLDDEWSRCQSESEAWVDAEDIASIVSSWTGVPVMALTEEESSKLLRMEDALRHRIIGQDQPIEVVARAVRRSRAGLKDPRRPIGVFLFLGPTGVGKTLLARALAGFLFEDEDALIRVDMSEYMEKFAVSRLMGAPPGYVGYDEGGQLTEAVRRRPYSVVLLDEIEKADAEVFSILLQVMEDGRLTDSQGRNVDFRNTVVIMTGNVGAREIHRGRALGFGGAADEAALSQEEADRRHAVMSSKIMDEVKRVFRPEFLNRLDEVVIFRSLSREQILAIVDLEVGRIHEALGNRHMTLQLTEAAKELLGREGYEPSLGARPLRRAIQRRIEDPVSEAILLERFRDGDTIVGDVENGEIVFRRVEAPVECEAS